MIAYLGHVPTSGRGTVMNNISIERRENMARQFVFSFRIFCYKNYNSFTIKHSMRKAICSRVTHAAIEALLVVAVEGFLLFDKTAKFVSESNNIRERGRERVRAKYLYKQN